MQRVPCLYSGLPKWCLAVLGVQSVKDSLWPEARCGGHGSAMLRIKVHSSQMFRELKPVAAARQGTETELCFPFYTEEIWAYLHTGGDRKKKKKKKKKGKATAGGRGFSRAVVQFLSNFPLVKLFGFCAAVVLGCFSLYIHSKDVPRWQVLQRPPGRARGNQSLLGGWHSLKLWLHPERQGRQLST